MIDKEISELKNEIEEAMLKFKKKTLLTPVIEARLFNDPLKKRVDGDILSNQTADISIKFTRY